MLLLLLVSVLAQAFFTLVRCHLMSLSFLTAWHNSKVLQLFLNNVHKYLGWLECRNIVSRNSHGRVFCNVSGSLLSPVFDDEAAEATEINRIALCKRILNILHK